MNNNDWGRRTFYKTYEIYGWASSERIAQYKNFISHIKNGKIVEIGVYGGDSLLSVLDLCYENKNKIIGIDPWEKNSLANGQPLTENTTPKLSEFHYNMKKNRINLENILSEVDTDNRVELMFDFSSNISALFEDNSVDMVYIDGAHDYASVLKDLECWHSKVKEGGILWGDDYNWPSVRKAVFDFCNKNGYAALDLGAFAWQCKKT